MTNKLLFSLPKPTKMIAVDNTRNYTNKKWPVETFVTQENEHVNDAIEYYYQKMLSFTRITNQRLSKQLQDWYGVQSIEELFAQASDTYDKQFTDIWSQIQKTKTSDLQPMVNQLNEYTRQLRMAGEQTISFASILSILTNQQPGKISSNQIPGSINIDSFQTKLLSFVNAYGHSSPHQLGAHRALTLGEIYEQGVNSMLASNTKGLLNHFATGHQRTMKTLTSDLAGKTDGLLTISGINIDLSEISPWLSGTLSSDGQATQTVTLEVYDDIDMSDGGLNNAIQRYINSPAVNMMGIQNKAWIKPNGTMGSFAKSAEEVRARVGGISQWFANDGRFANYTGYTLSKYLINAIGAHNALMATGAHGIMPTYMWLWNLYMSGKHLRHSFNLMKSVDFIRKDHTREMLAKNERGYHGAAIYEIRNNIIIANRKFA